MTSETLMVDHEIFDAWDVNVCAYPRFTFLYKGKEEKNLADEDSVSNGPL